MNEPSRTVSPLRVAVIGAGYGQVHITGILAAPSLYHLSAICDQDIERVQREVVPRCAVPPGCRVMRDYHEVMADPQIDAVVVSLPHHLHAAVCVSAARSRKHILVDKPIARTLAEADSIIREAKLNEVTVMVAYNQRFEPKYRMMHDIIVAGGIGEVVHAVTRHNQIFNPPSGAHWRMRDSVGGGCVMGSGVHNLDLMRWFFGEPQEVFAYGVGDPQRLEAEAAASISFRYLNGMIVNFSCNWAAHGAQGNMHGDEEWTVFGSSGDLAVHGRFVRVGREFGRKVEEIAVAPDLQESLYGHFANAIRRRVEPLTNGPDAKRSLALVLRIYESMQTGLPVRC